MYRLTATTRIAICLAFLSVGGLVLADALGLIPNAALIVREQRQALCESMAVHCSVLASNNDITHMQAALHIIARRNPDIISIGVRRKDGRLLVDIDQHDRQWQANQEGRSNDTHVYVPIFAGKELWGKVEVHFSPGTGYHVLGSHLADLPALYTASGVICFTLFFLFLRRVLQDLDPNKVVPDRVRRALDSLAEGLLLMDNDERIVLANRAFAEYVGQAADDLQGRRAKELPWTVSNGDECPALLPWQQVGQDGRASQSQALGLRVNDEIRHVFMVNTSHVSDDRGHRRGIMASFDDVTQLETKNDQLMRMVSALKQSQEDVRAQNEELKRLATRDALTGCLNRRAYFEYFERRWSEALRNDEPLSCAMVDVDHFKSINDTHGHARGDQVLKKVGEALLNVARDSDIVCRYGGEEFCVLLPQTPVEGAVDVGDRYRQAISAIDLGGLVVSASVGVASREVDVQTPQQLLDRADQALYVAKRSGRNQVACWDRTTSRASERPAESTPATPQGVTVNSPAESIIPFNAVGALLSALAYRDADTAAHSTRVADLCAAAGRGLMSVTDVYVLETAALLHDIGKIGVPDAILLKPGPLTKDEWRVMRTHDRIGVEIVASSFACAELTEIVRWHHCTYGGNSHDPAAPVGEAIPLGAQMLTIADAYDAIVSDRVYRKGRSSEEAFAELRRCAGTQFDPNIVEHFIETVQTRGETSADDSSTDIPRHAALSIGLQVERIAQAVDDHDLESLRSLVQRLQATATKNGMTEIGTLADQLHDLAEEEPGFLELVETTHELLDLCRDAQRAHVSPTHESRAAD